MRCYRVAALLNGVYRLVGQEPVECPTGQAAGLSTEVNVSPESVRSRTDALGGISRGGTAMDSHLTEVMSQLIAERTSQWFSNLVACLPSGLGKNGVDSGVGRRGETLRRAVRMPLQRSPLLALFTLSARDRVPAAGTRALQDTAIRRCDGARGTLSLIVRTFCHNLLIEPSCYLAGARE